MKPSLTLSMIVRNGGDDLAQCLASVRGVVDEIVVADTGSTDSSMEVAASFGARIRQVVWKDDFAAARNEALRMAQSDWVLVLDADEQLDEYAIRQIPAALESAADGYLVTIRNYVDNLNERLWDRPAIANDGILARAARFAGYLPHENVRLFRNRAEIYFEGRVHETVGARIEALAGKLGRTDLLIHHFGFTASPEQKAAKNRFYRELGHKKIVEMPNNGQAHFELGLVEFDNFHSYEDALELFVRACELSPRLAVAWFFRGMALARLSRPLEAAPCFQRARQIGGNPIQCWEAEGDALYNSKQFILARQAYRHALRITEVPALLSKLGLAELRAGHVEAGLKKMQCAIANGNSAELYDRLITGLVSLRRIADAAQVSEDKLRNVGSSPTAFLRTAALWIHAQQMDRGLQIVASGLKEFPASAELRATYEEIRKNSENILRSRESELKLSGASPIGKQQRNTPGTEVSQ